jgi:AraC family transcriptional regulator of adaptative response/methylated-DNA-[protein]-cysteine methyltransferase
MLTNETMSESAARYIDDDVRWSAFRARDVAADGKFIVAVKTTGIYCRPVCPARSAKRQNVEFFATTDEARRAGYRACLRCRPDDVSERQRVAKLITRACRRIESDEAIPSVGDLAKDARLSEGRFHRLFKQATGLSPRQYALAKRVEAFRDRLKRGETVTAALYDAGFNSSSRAYEASRRLGAKPSDVARGGATLTIRVGVARSSLGFVGVGMSDRGLCALTFGDSAQSARDAVQSHFPKATLIDAGGSLTKELGRVVALVEEPKDGIDLPLDIRGTAFQERVWQALRRIPVGGTRTYGEIAKAIGKPKAQRAVANACGANPIAVAIPCHRVVAAHGALGGYGYGMKRKHALLKKEAAE